MTRLSPIEAAAIEFVQEQPMLDQVERWAAINSGTRNLAGVKAVGDLLADAFALAGEIDLVDAAPVDSVAADGTISALEHGRHLHLTVRPDAPVQMLLTGHMDTVYPVDHPFQSLAFRPDRTLHGPGVADM